MGGVDVGALAAPAFRGGGQVGDPQTVAPAAGGLEQGQLRAGVRPLAAGEDPHGRGPALELVAAGSLAQQPGQLGDVRFLDPAGPVGAALVRAGPVSAALADLALAVDGDLPGGLGDRADRGLLPRAQFPADGVGDLVAVPGGEPVQLLDQGVAGAGPVAGDHQPAAQCRRERRDRLAQQAQVIGGGVAPGRAGAQHPGQRLGHVIAGRDDRVMAVALEVRLCQLQVQVSARGHDGRVQPDAGHALQRPVRDPDRRQPAVPRDALRPCVPPRLVHRGRERLPNDDYVA